MSNPNKDLKPPALVTKQSRRRKNKPTEPRPSDALRTESPEVHIQLESMANEDFQSNQGSFDGNNTIANFLRGAGKNSFSDVVTHATKYLKKKKKENDEPAKHGNAGRDKKHNQLRSSSISLKYPIVNKERLNYSVYLDEEDDREMVINILRKSAMARTKEELLFLQKPLQISNFSWISLLNLIMLVFFTCLKNSILNDSQLDKRYSVKARLEPSFISLLKALLLSLSKKTVLFISKKQTDMIILALRQKEMRDYQII